MSRACHNYPELVCIRGEYGGCGAWEDFNGAHDYCKRKGLWWNLFGERPESDRAADPKERIRRLEARVAELEAQLRDQK